MLFLFEFSLYSGPPICPNIQAKYTSNNSLVASIQQSQKTWLAVHYHIEVAFYNMSVLATHNSTITSNDSVLVKPPQPGTPYNISVTPCNMAGCNRSCEIHSEQATAVPTGGGECAWCAQSHK